MFDYREIKEQCDRCKANTWDCIGEFTPVRGKPQEVLECAFCGLRVRVAVGYGVPKKTEEERAAAELAPEEQPQFRFLHGRFKGMTLAEADSQPNGRKYLELMRDTNEKLRGRIEEYLTTAASSA